MKCPYDEGLRKQYFENKVNDYLFEILIKTFSEKPASVKISAEENEAVFNARDLIKADLTKHLSIKEISRIVRLNEFKLKNGFKEKFRAGIFEYLLQERMATARQLIIETNKPMKEIASLTGFNQITNFITAFKKYFGHTPGELRRK
jgi:AraC-like DNA-binding protein